MRLGWVVALAVFAGPAAAHNLAPAYLELRELADGDVAVRWKQSTVTPRGVRVEPELPCPAAAPAELSAPAGAVVAEWRIACGAPLVGRRIAVKGLAGSGIDTVVRVALADGREIRALLSGGAPALVIPARERARSVLASYGALGVEHLWTGLDHVLFVAGLTLLLGATRRLLIAITAFTAGHSATLALAALGFVHVPQAAVEVAIAGTIVALAVSLARSPDPRGPAAMAEPAPAARRESGLARRPALLPFAFGLLHGLGFAGALGALGLPQHAIPLALFSFNVGIELGQLALVALLLGAAWGAMRTAWLAEPRRVARALEAAATGIGSLGVFWCLERAASALFP
jgi:hypothetical protein